MEHFKNSKMYMMYEMRDSLKEGIKGRKELLSLENEFQADLKSLGEEKYEKYHFMFEDWEKEKDMLEKVIKHMEKRLKVVEALITSYEKQDEVAKVVDLTVTMVLTALEEDKLAVAEEEQEKEITIEIPPSDNN